MGEARFLVFRVGPEMFLAEISSVRQVLQGVSLTRVPAAPPFIEGIVLLHGTPVPVVDLRARLFPDASPAEYPLIVVISSEIGLLGLRVDEIRKTETLQLDALVPPPPLVGGLSGDLFIGVAEFGGQLHLLLDLEHVLTSVEKEELKAAAENRPA